MAESYDSYLTRLGDTAQIGLWEQAIRQEVRPGDVVVEIGTGLGTFAVFGCVPGPPGCTRSKPIA